MVDSAPNIRNKQSQGKERGAFVAMLRGYRSIIVAITGLILIGANVPPKQAAPAEATKEQREISESLKDIATTLKRPDEPDQTTKPCDPQKPDRKSDLCAQWKAADGAAQAAEWAKWQTLLSALGILGLLASLHFTRKAVKAAENSTKDAENALQIAKRNAESAEAHVAIAEKAAARQLRPYVFIERIDVSSSEPSDNPIRIVVRNFGKTPAQNVNVIITSRWCKFGEVVACTPSLDDARLLRDMAPQHSHTIWLPIPPDEWAKMLPRVSKKEAVLVINMTMCYESDDGEQFGPFPETIIIGEYGARQVQPEDNLREG